MKTVIGTIVVVVAGGYYGLGWYRKFQAAEAPTSKANVSAEVRVDESTTASAPLRTEQVLFFADGTLAGDVLKPPPPPRSSAIPMPAPGIKPGIDLGWTEAELYPERIARTVTPQAYFEAKYGQCSVEQREQSLLELTEELRRGRQAAFDQAFEAGDFQVRLLDLEHDEQQLIACSEERPFTAVRAWSRSDGRIETHIVSLPFDAYPEFYKLDDEVRWLREQLPTKLAQR